MKRFMVNAEADKEDTLVFSALLGISVFAVVQLLGAPAIDMPLTVSLYAFAVAIPALAVSVYAYTIQSPYKYAVEPAYMKIIAFCGSLASLTGTAGIFWHFSRSIGITFLAISLLGIIFSVNFNSAVREVNADEDK